MGILENNFQPQLSLEELAARRIIGQARESFESFLASYKQGTNMFWNNPRGATPAQIANSLGNKAAEVFSLHYALGQFLESVKPGCTTEINQSIPWNTFTLNQDGTVTISEQQPE